MASRAELVALCDELNLKSENLTIEELKKKVREEADRRWSKFTLKNYKLCSTVNKSRDLLRFLTEEYDYSLFDKDGNKVDINGNIIKRAK